MSLNRENIRDIVRKMPFWNVWPFRFKKLDEQTILLTNDSGKFSYLSPEDFSLFLGWNISEEKRDELTQKGFLGRKVDALAKDFAKKHLFLASGPSLHIIVVTLRCNHICKYCHSSAVPMDTAWTDLDQETAKKIVDTIFFTTAPAVTIEFQWGEPLVNWDVVTFIIEYAKYKSTQVGKKVQFALVSNMSLMDHEKLSYLLKHNVGMNTSLDGDEKTHNFNRVYRSGNSYELATHWIREIDRFSREKFHEPYPISPLMTVTKETLKNWKSCVDAYIKLGVSMVFWRPVNPLGFGDLAYKQLGYSPEEYLEVYEKVLDYIIDQNLQHGVAFYENYAVIMLKKMLSNVDPNYVETRSPCGAVIGQVVYNFDGKIYSCDEGRMLAKAGDDSFCVGEVGNDPRQTYVDIVNSPTTKAILSASLTEGLPWYEFDAYKPYLWSCPVLNYKARGTIYPNYSTDHKRKIESGILDILFIRLKDAKIEKLFRSWI